MTEETSTEADDQQRSDSDWAKLRRAEKRAKEAEARAEAMERQMAFRDAGIDPSDPRQKYFVKGYEGESNAEAIRRAAVEAGFLADERPAGHQAELDSQDAAAQLSAGAPAESISTDAAERRIEQAFAEGGVEALMRQLAAEGVPRAQY